MRRKEENGSILVLTLWIVALLGVMFLSVSRTIQFAIRSSEWEQLEFEAEEILLTLGVVCVGTLLEDQDLDVDAPNEKWGIPLEGNLQQVLADGKNMPLPKNDFNVEIIPFDEFGKVNVNLAPEDLLKILMDDLGRQESSSDLVSAILDWRDADDIGEAESGYYSGLDVPYSPANGDFTRLEEMLFVRGIDHLLFFGEDADHDGLLDPEEDDGDQLLRHDNGDGVFQRGLSDILTVFSTEDGSFGININTAPEMVLRAIMEYSLDEETSADETVQKILKHRRGQGKLDYGEEFQAFRNEDEIRKVIGEGTYDRMLSKDIEFRVNSEAFRFHMRASLPDRRFEKSAELVVVRTNEEIRVVEWRE